MKKLTPVIALLSLGSIPAFAYGAAAMDNPSGPYVGGGYGRFNYNARNLGDVGTAVGRIVNDSSDNAWKIFAGWRFNPYIALEANYIDFGRPSDKVSTGGSNGNYRVDLSGFAPYLIGSLPLGPVELFAKVGEYYYDVKTRIDFDNPGPDVDSSHSRNDFTYGAGVGVTVLERLHLRAEYETIDIEDAKNSDAVWLSAAWRF